MKTAVAHGTYIVSVSRELVEEYLDWTRIQDLPACWFKVIPHDDGTAEVWLNSGEARPEEESW